MNLTPIKIMKKNYAVILSFAALCAVGILGCSKSPDSSAPVTPPPATASAPVKNIYAGDLELSKNVPVSVTLEETNVCTITTMALPGGILNLDIVVETKGATGVAPHTSVTTHVGQQFSFPVGNTSVSYTAKLKAE